jgi:hypothetical protein
MKFSIYFLSLLLCSFLVLACSDHIPNEHEQYYLDTADSLSLYKDVTYMKKQLEVNEKARDYMSIGFDEFKEKYDMIDDEMNVLSDLMQGHVDLARMLNSMNSAE